LGGLSGRWGTFYDDAPGFEVNPGSADIVISANFQTMYESFKPLCNILFSMLRRRDGAKGAKEKKAIGPNPGTEEHGGAGGVGGQGGLGESGGSTGLVSAALEESAESGALEERVELGMAGGEEGEEGKEAMEEVAIQGVGGAAGGSGGLEELGTVGRGVSPQGGEEWEGGIVGKLFRKLMLAAPAMLRRPCTVVVRLGLEFGCYLNDAEAQWATDFFARFLIEALRQELGGWEGETEDVRDALRDEAEDTSAYQVGRARSFLNDLKRDKASYRREANRVQRVEAARERARLYALPAAVAVRAELYRVATAVTLKYEYEAAVADATAAGIVAADAMMRAGMRGAGMGVSSTAGEHSLMSSVVPHVLGGDAPRLGHGGAGGGAKGAKENNAVYDEEGGTEGEGGGGGGGEGGGGVMGSEVGVGIEVAKKKRPPL
jgi:hypothetical protein